MSERQNCPCQSSKAYKECCEPLHQQQNALTAEQLMRSRYSAFKLGLVAYLIETLAPSKRSADDHAVLTETIESTEWLGLRIIDHQQTPQQAEVEFIAFYQDEASVGQLHERSQFVNLEGKWFYQAGYLLPPIKLSRNEPCVCGSGKKLKRCHTT